MLAMNIALWMQVRDVRAGWQNVPPVPSESNIALSSMGDKEFAYRSMGIMIQNLGETGGRSVHLGDYDYERLVDWMFLGHGLNPKSDFLPALAAFYFGASQYPDQLRYIVSFLQHAGLQDYDQKWRWLAQAGLMARFKVKDMDLALSVAQKLQQKQDPNMPPWAKAMPAYILNQQGEKEAAYQVMLAYLKAGEGELHPSEVNATLAYICEQILSPQEAQQDPICKTYE